MSNHCRIVVNESEPSDNDQLIQESSLLSISVHHEEGPSAIDSVQPLLTKAVAHKKAKEWDEALACLDEAYKLAAQQPYDYMEWSKEPLGNERSWRAPGIDLCLLNILNAERA